MARRDGATNVARQCATGAVHSGLAAACFACPFALGVVCAVLCCVVQCVCVCVCVSSALVLCGPVSASCSEAFGWECERQTSKTVSEEKRRGEERSRKKAARRSRREQSRGGGEEGREGSREVNQARE